MVSGDVDKIHPISRSQILDDLKDFVQTGRVPYELLFNLFKYLHRETEYAPWYSARQAILQIKNSLEEGCHEYNTFKQFVAYISEPFYKRNPIGGNGTHFENYLRELATNLACEFGLSQCLKESHDLLLEAMESRSFKSPDNRALIYSHGLRSANASVVQNVWNYFLNVTNSNERIEIISSLGNIADKETLNFYLNEALNINNTFITSDERTALLISIVRGSQYGLLQTIETLTSSVDEWESFENHIEPKVFHAAADNINTLKTYKKVRIFVFIYRKKFYYFLYPLKCAIQFTQLLIATREMNIFSEQKNKKIENTLEAKFAWLNGHQTEIKTCVLNLETPFKENVANCLMTPLLMLLVSVFVTIKNF